MISWIFLGTQFLWILWEPLIQQLPFPTNYKQSSFISHKSEATKIQGTDKKLTICEKWPKVISMIPQRNEICRFFWMVSIKNNNEIKITVNARLTWSISWIFFSSESWIAEFAVCFNMSISSLVTPIISCLSKSGREVLSESTNEERDAPVKSTERLTKRTCMSNLHCTLMYST